MCLNFWEVDYRRLFRAYGDQLDFRAEAAGTQEFSATDFTSGPVAVWDITAPLQPKRLSGVATTGAGPYTARFRATPAVGDRFWMQGEGSFAAPASIVLRSSTAGLRNPAGGADTVIVTPAFLRPAAETLAGWHRAHGRRTVIVDLQDVYDEFNNGIRHPVAVRQMMAWAAANWTAPAPAYLVLMGDGHLNLKGYAAAQPCYAPATNPIPPYLIFKDPWLGEIAADGLYGDITGDDLPDVAVGRIPANTLAEANTIVSKIVGYDETGRAQPWQRRAVFVADRSDPTAGDFAALSDAVIAGNLPADLTAQRIYFGSTAVPNATTARTAINNAINAGALMVQYTGHGTTQWWSKEKIWRVDDVPGLTNTTMLPVIMSFNCLDGYFIYPSSANQGLEETMVRASNGGSVAAIAPSGEGLTYDQKVFRKILMDTLFKDGVRDLGRALMITKRDYAFDPNGKYAAYGAPRGVNYLVYEMNLFGDPALKHPGALCDARAGLRHIDPPPPATTNVELNWTAIADAASYNVYRSNTNPYFDPGTATLVQNVGVPAFIDPGAIGNPALNKYYVVEGGRCLRAAIALQRRLQAHGEFSFALAGLVSDR